MSVRRRVDIILRAMCFVLSVMLLLKLGVLYFSDDDDDFDKSAQLASTLDPFEEMFHKIETEIEATFEERRRRIQDICEEHFASDYKLSWTTFNERRLKPSVGYNNWWERLFVIPKANLIFCSIPQVDSVDWLRHVTHASMHISNAPEPQSKRPPALPSDYNWLNFSINYVVPLAGYKAEVAQNILQNYKKVIWVRDPLDRLVMAWEDKLQNSEYFSKERVAGLIRSQQPNATSEDVEKILPISLETFFTFLANQPSSYSFDVNWRSYRDLCSVCQLSYDFVLFRETPQNMARLPFEVDFVFRQAIGRRDLPSFQVTPPEPIYNMTMFAKMSKLLINRVLDVYKLDNALFGFQRPKELLGI